MLFKRFKKDSPENPKSELIEQLSIKIKLTLIFLFLSSLITGCNNPSILSKSPVPTIVDMARMADLGHDETIQLLEVKKYKLASDTIIHKQRITELSYIDGKFEVSLVKNELRDKGDIFKWINVTVLPKELENGFYVELKNHGYKLLREENGISIRTKVYRRANETVNVSQIENKKIPLTVSYMKIDHEIRL